MIGTELCSKKNQFYASMFISGCDIIVYIPSSIYFKYISKDWRYLFYIYFSLSVVFVSLSYFVPESPRFLYEVGNLNHSNCKSLRRPNRYYIKARSILNTMSESNNSSLHNSNWNFYKENENYSAIPDLSDNTKNIKNYVKIDPDELNETSDGKPQISKLKFL